jgi:hypothetical protein
VLAPSFHCSPYLLLYCAQAKRREKEADERDRAKLKQKLEDDRKERRRKLGKPEELTEEEKVRVCVHIYAFAKLRMKGGSLRRRGSSVWSGAESWEGCHDESWYQLKHEMQVWATIKWQSTNCSSHNSSLPTIGRDKAEGKACRVCVVACISALNVRLYVCRCFWLCFSLLSILNCVDSNVPAIQHKRRRARRSCWFHNSSPYSHFSCNASAQI